MKLRIGIVALILILSCSERSTYKVTFCQALDDKRCVSADTVFDFGKRVFIQFTSEKAFEQDTIVGMIYGLPPAKDIGDRFMFAQKVFAIVPGQNLIEHYIPFEEFGSIGVYEIEFTDKNGAVLGVNTLRVRHPDESQSLQ